MTFAYEALAPNEEHIIRECKHGGDVAGCPSRGADAFPATILAKAASSLGTAA